MTGSGALGIKGPEAYRRFGKGRHPAAGNYGDCLAHALAKVSGEPLLSKCNDFGHTDVDVLDIGGLPTVRQPVGVVVSGPGWQSSSGAA